MPFLQAASLTYLMEQIGDHDVVMPNVLGEQQPLHAIYARTCLEPIRRRLAADRLKIVGFLPEVRVRVVTAAELIPFDPELLAFQNLNTEEEFETAARRLQGN
jgi:molybdopterin-guanine dinucleotide biosynthesis protein A